MVGVACSFVPGHGTWRRPRGGPPAWRPPRTRFIVYGIMFGGTCVSFARPGRAVAARAPPGLAVAGSAGKLAALCLTSYIAPPAGVSPVDHDCGAVLHAGGGGGGGGEHHHTPHISLPLITGTEAS